jgi:hypothetical protein
MLIGIASTRDSGVVEDDVGRRSCCCGRVCQRDSEDGDQNESCEGWFTLAWSGEGVGSAAATAANTSIAVFMGECGGGQRFASECVHVQSSLLIDSLRNTSRTRPTAWLHGTLLPSTGYASPSLRFVVFWARSKVSVTVATIAANGSLGGHENA